MENDRETVIREQLLERQRRLTHAISEFKDTKQIARLLEEVDSALQRMEKGTYGLCEVCHEAIEEDRLIADPLLYRCLEHLSDLAIKYSHLSPAELIEDCLADVTRFLAGAPRQDDLTVMAVRRT